MKNNDVLLDLLHSLGAEVTLFVSGRVFCGTITSASDFFRRSMVGTTTDETLRSAYGQWVEVIQTEENGTQQLREKDDADLTDDERKFLDRPRTHIHLKDAWFFSGTTVIPTTRTGNFRISLRSVNGWSHGVLIPSQ